MTRIKERIKPIYVKFFSDFYKNLRKELSDCKTVLDLGCGFNSPIQYCDASFKVGVELFDSYIEESKKKGIHNQYIKRDVTKVDFKPKSFDAVIMIDVLEHLSKEDGLKLIEKMEKWAKKKIVILTPNGFIKNEIEDNNNFQEHKSGWKADDFKGFKVRGIGGWKFLKGEKASLKYRPHIFFFFISALTQKIVYHYPGLAWHLFAVKEIRND